MTVRLDEHLLTEAKKVAADSGRTLKAFLEDALRDALARRATRERRTRVRLETFRGDGLWPGVDLDKPVALLDAMEIALAPSAPMKDGLANG